MKMASLALVLVFLWDVAKAQISDWPDESIAGIPVNYTEAKVGKYTLPDPLRLANGQQVSDAQTWFEKRRPEILRLFEENQFGKVPATAPKVIWKVASTDPNALDGAVVFKQLAGHMGSPEGPAIEATLYTPRNHTRPVPVLVNLTFSFGPRNTATRPTGPMAMRGGPADLISRGYAYATIIYNTIETDIQGQPNINIVRKLALAPGQSAPAPDQWGTIAAWAWGISRFVDYLQTVPAIDPNRIAITGVSRLGKTVLWAGACDQRIALVIDSCSGEGGSALSRRNYGETIKHLTAPTRYPYQFCANYAKWAEKVDEFAVDGHMLIALIAPRPVLIQTGNTDKWADPYGQFLAAVAAGPVYKLLGKQDLGTDKLPAAGLAILNTIGFIMHEGGHGLVPSDWDVFLRFMDMHLGPPGTSSS